MLENIKVKLSEFIHFNADENNINIVEFFEEKFKEKPPKAVSDTLKRIKNPFKMLERVYELCQKLMH